MTLRILSILAYAVVWVASASAIALAVYVTESAKPLWFLLIPGLISLKIEIDTHEKPESEKTQ